MGTFRESSTRKTREELLTEYCKVTNSDFDSLKSMLQRKSNKCIENMAKKEGISIFKRVYLSTNRTFKVEIIQNGEITSTFTVCDDNLVKAIKMKTGYKVKLEDAEPDKADMRVTIVGSETRINAQTPRVRHYRIIAAYRRKGTSFEEIDWKTGKTVEREG